MQSAVYRTTLAGVLVCPLVGWGLWLAGFSGWSLALPQPWTYEPAATVVAEAPLPVAPPPAASEPAIVEAPPAALAAMDSFEQQPPFAAPESSPSEIVAAPSVAPVDFEPVAAEPVPQTIEQPIAAEAEPGTFSVHAWGWLALGTCVLWLAISGVLLVRLAAAWWRLSRLRQGAAAADAAILATCGEMAERLGVAAPEVLKSPYLPSPCLAGLRRPAVLLPEAELSLSLRDVLVHELAHLVRRDCHWNLLRQLATSVFFFQPLLWKVSSRLEATAEEVCDDYVVHFGGDRHEYAYRLVDIAELSAAPVAPAGLGIVSLRSMLARRVSRILDTSRSLSTRVGNLLLAIVLAGGLAGTAIVGLVGIGPQPSAAEVAATDQQEVTDEKPGDEAEGSIDEPSDSTPQLITVRGRVVDATGKPAPGAAVRVTRSRWRRPEWNDAEHAELGEVKADAEGRFRMRHPLRLKFRHQLSQVLCTVRLASA